MKERAAKDAIKKIAQREGKSESEIREVSESGNTTLSIKRIYE